MTLVCSVFLHEKDHFNCLLFDKHSFAVRTVIVCLGKKDISKEKVKILQRVFKNAIKLHGHK